MSKWKFFCNICYGCSKKCNREEFGDLAFRKKSLLSELLGLDAISEVWDLSNEEQSRPIQIRGDIEYLAFLEEIFVCLVCERGGQQYLFLSQTSKFP